MSLEGNIDLGALTSAIGNIQSEVVEVKEEQSIAPLPLVTYDDFEVLKHFLRIFFDSFTEEETKKWSDKESFKKMKSELEIELYSKENILKYIRRGVEKYEKMKNTNKYCLENSVGHIFSALNNFHSNTFLSEYPLRVIERMFNNNPKSFYIRYEDYEGGKHIIRIPKKYVDISRLPQCTEIEAQTYISIFKEGEHMISLIFFYMLGIQNQ